MLISVTSKAIAEIKKLITKEQKGLRIGVKGGGCSGLSYVLDFIEESRADDKTIEVDSIKFFIDPKSAIYLNGTQLDFSDGLTGTGFNFSNPNVKKTCGCGSSFSV